MRISDWSSDVCSSDLAGEAQPLEGRVVGHAEAADRAEALAEGADDVVDVLLHAVGLGDAAAVVAEHAEGVRLVDQQIDPVTPLHVDELVERGLVAQHRVDALDDHQLRSEEHTSELQSLMRISY